MNRDIRSGVIQLSLLLTFWNREKCFDFWEVVVGFSSPRHHIRIMASDRHFPNTLADYKAPGGKEEKLKEQSIGPLAAFASVTEDDGVATTPPSYREHLFPSQEVFVKAALELRSEVVQSTYRRNGPRVNDPSMYVGVLGTGFLCLKVYLATGSEDDLALCLDIVDACSAGAQTMRPYVTFLCGQPGIYALGAVAAKYKGDKTRMNHYLALFDEVANQKALSSGPSEGGLGVPYELLYGRAGFLWAALFINKHLGEETVPWTVTGPVVQAIIQGGRAGAVQTKCPLMYQWHGTRYWGAAHGLVGIMHVLMHFPLSADAADDVKGVLRYMIKNRFVGGNYPSSEGNNRDRLVHWCHGAPGVALTLCKAAQVFPEEEQFRTAALEAGEVVWERGLLRRLGLCHGISGNAYVFLALYRLSGQKKHLHRAKMFAGFLHDRAFSLIATGEMHGGDHPHSLFEGLAGTACLWLDVAQPNNSRFPGFEL
ncbi:hypothetical protein R1sor_017394 [Riccia sorocarpa]|uniref:LanC-like protein 2 n=1 Tax=Riccia sorocarpa TaxID=122646 RepID=A0ABD3IAR8_9MARC